ncbi:hypothetical protein [Priestia aryabhattai]
MKIEIFDYSLRNNKLEVFVKSKGLVSSEQTYRTYWLLNEDGLVIRNINNPTSLNDTEYERLLLQELTDSTKVEKEDRDKILEAATLRALNL